MLGQGLVLELYFRALPYHTEDRAERQRSAVEAEDAWTRAKDVRADIPARFAQIPLLILEGRWDEAYPLALAAHTAGAGNMAHKPYDTVALGPLAYARGETDTAWSLVREWLPDGPHTAPGTTVYYVVGLQRIAVALALDASDLPTARAWLESYERWLAWSAAVLGQAEAALLWSRYYHAAGDRDRAYRNAERALRCGSDPRQPLAILAAHRVLGELDTEAGRFADAEQHFAVSLALADACAAPYERALTLHALAEFRAATGKSAAALALLDEVQTICTPLGAKPALARAAALAQRLVAGKEPPLIYPAGLTAREVEVLRLVADGLTDGQVAERLFLSPRTVGRHLTSIYTKLGVSTRTAAGRFALEHHLT